uniref:uncharacterized protein LOC120887649 n=1 Tax=Ictidomys tridecemlineatus TaxID=43179 RepID=UPI001A9E7866|nr:uncharacterized protein LOC120887649 [Ictidomys tridecemlineatus]
MSQAGLHLVLNGATRGHTVTAKDGALAHRAAWATLPQDTAYPRVPTASGDGRRGWTPGPKSDRTWTWSDRPRHRPGKPSPPPPEAPRVVLPWHLISHRNSRPVPRRTGPPGSRHVSPLCARRVPSSGPRLSPRGSGSQAALVTRPCPGRVAGGLHLDPQALTGDSQRAAPGLLGFHGRRGDLTRHTLHKPVMYPRPPGARSYGQGLVSEFGAGH